MNAILIARVSTDDQRDALPAQVHKLVDYAKRKQFTYELIEFQESAYKGSREQFKLLIERIKESESLTAIVFDKVDRYTRDSSAEETRTLQKLYKSGRIELHFPSDNLVVDKDSPATDIMRLGLNAVLAQYYSDSISDNVKRRLQQKLRDGEWIGQAPFGYDNITYSDGRKTIEINTVEAQVVRDIYEWYAVGNTSYRRIRDQLRASHAILFAASKVEFILKNEFYIGTMKSKGVSYPHKYERIVTPELFDRVKSVRQGFDIKPVQFGGLPYTYRGIFTCAECGCSITFEKKKAKYIYGHCTQKKGNHGAAYIPESVFAEEVRTIFKSIEIPEDELSSILVELQKTEAHTERSRIENLSRVDMEISRYTTRIDRMYDDRLDDKVSENLYIKKYKEYTEKIEVLKATRKKFELVADNVFRSASYLLNLANEAPKLFEKANIDQKRSLLNMIGSNYEVQGRLLRWKLKKPYDCMAICNVSGNWLRLLGSNQRHPR